MRQIKFLCIIVFVFGFLYPSYLEAYVGSPSRIFSAGEKEKPYSVFVEAVADIIYDRKAKFQSDDTEVDFYGGTAGLVYKDIFVLYGGAGTAKVEAEFLATQGKRIRWESDYGFTWLVGGNLKLYEKELRDFHNSRLLIDAGIQYRNTDLDADAITIDSVVYNLPHSEIRDSSMEYNDWHIAVACGLDMGMFSPYAGIKYSDFESCLRVTKGGTLYEKDNAEADDNFGVFAGASLKILDTLTATIEASFLDEESISASLSWKF